VASVHVDAPQGAWLVYDDAYQPGWHASVDGREVPVYRADVAFKAVWVPAGAKVVRFWFRHGANHALSYAIAVFGVVCALALVAAVVASLRAVPIPGRRTDPG
jgi:uncharacterized membrane protein YfhO